MGAHAAANDDVQELVQATLEQARLGKAPTPRKRRRRGYDPSAPAPVCPRCDRPIGRLDSFVWDGPRRAHITCPGRR